MSTDTMYFNSSRRLPTHSKNNSPAIPAKNNSTRSPNKRLNKKKFQKENNDNIPLQQLPNGQKPDFGHGNGNTNTNNGNNNNGQKNYRGKQKRDSYEQRENLETKKSYDSLTKNLKTLLINPEKAEKTVVETIIKSSSEHNPTSITPPSDDYLSNGTAPSMGHVHQPGFISPISTPMNIPQQLNTLPHMIPSPLVQNNIGPMGNSQYLPYNMQQQQQHQQHYAHNVGPQPIHPDAFRPGIPPMVAPQPPGFPGPPGMPIGAPNHMYMNHGMIPPPMNGFPSLEQQHQNIMPSPTLPRIIPPNPISIINPVLTNNVNDVNNISTKSTIPNGTMNGKTTGNKSNKRTGSRSSKTFAGASFATDVPNECSLPKPSFT
ncbi:Enhancer of mRNA-decapping protein 2 [Nakaseomyces bracarensis]|uniref:Enhancer of mRNA-decapping protein 2 n=1 Tax=Nakaseomyces bracarensis TaxID=273131 RepID=A0ABR4NZK7_9SACH